MGVIARCNGTLLVEDGPRVAVVEQGGSWRGMAIFVLVIVAASLAAAGVALVSRAPAAGAGALAGAALLGPAIAWLVRARRRHAARPPDAPRLTFDFAAGVLLDASGNALARLDQIRLTRAWQLGSSARKLVASHPNGWVVVARGNPFGDHVGEVEQALRARGVRS